MNKLQDNRLKKQIIAKSIYYNIPEQLVKKIYALGFLDMDHSKTKDKPSTLIDRISLLGSTPSNFNSDEWEVTGAEYCMEPSACVCGQQGIKQRYVLTNYQTNISISIGGSCLKNHFGISPEDELLEFSKSFSEPYMWLGRKYDTFIFSVLGFKNAYLYFRCRDKKQSVPKEHNKLLKDQLSESIYAFHFPEWRKRFSRAENLLKVLRHSKTRKEIEANRPKLDGIYVDEANFSKYIKELKAQIDSCKIAFDKNEIELMKAESEKMKLMIDEAQKYRYIAKRISQRYKLPTELSRANSVIDKLKKKITKQTPKVQTEQSERSKNRENSKSDTAAKWVNVLLEATEDRLKHPKDSDFYIMGHFVKEERSKNPEISDKILIKLAKEHLSQTRRREDRTVEGLSRFSKWEMQLDRIASDEELGGVSIFAKRILCDFDAKAISLEPKQRVLFMLSLLNREKKIVIQDKLETDESSRRDILVLLESIQTMIFDKNTWLIEYIKNK